MLPRKELEKWSGVNYTVPSHQHLLFFRPLILWKEMHRRTDFVHLFISEERTNLLSFVIALFPIIGLCHGTALNWRQFIIHRYHSPPFFHRAKLVDNLVGPPTVSIDFSFEVLKWEIKANLGTFWIGILCALIRRVALPEFDSRRRDNFFLKSSCLYRASMTIKTLYYPTDAQIYNT